MYTLSIIINSTWEQRKFSDLYEKISEKNDLSYSLDKIISVANMYYKSDAKVSNEEYLRTYNIFRYGHNGSKSRYKLCFYYRSVRFGALYVRPQADDIYAKRQILSPNIVPSYVQRLVGGRIGAFVCHQYIDNQ